MLERAIKSIRFSRKTASRAGHFRAFQVTGGASRWFTQNMEVPGARSSLTPKQDSRSRLLMRPKGNSGPQPFGRTATRWRFWDMTARLPGSVWERGKWTVARADEWKINTAQE